MSYYSNLKQGVSPYAPSKDSSMEPLALTKPLHADPGVPPELLDLIIQNLKDAQSLRCLGLASRLFAALTRPYRLGILSVTTGTKCSDYVNFCRTTASDAPSLVWELRLDCSGFYIDAKTLASTKTFLLLLENVGTLSLKNRVWGNLPVFGTLRTAHIHTLSLCKEFFPDMAEMEAFFRTMPALKTVFLSEGSGTGPAISELHLTDVRNSGKLMDHVIAYATPFSLRNIKRLHIYTPDYGLVNFLTKVLESTGDMDELIITQPEPAMGLEEDFYVEEEVDGEEETEDDYGDETRTRTVTMYWTTNTNPKSPLSLLGLSDTFRRTLYHQLLGQLPANTRTMMVSKQRNTTGTLLLRWLTYRFSQSQSPPSIRTIEINISADVDGDILDFVNARLWRAWDTQLARCGDGLPDVNITVKSIIREGEVKDEVEEKILSVVTAREEEALEAVRKCIRRNMANVRRARRLCISTTVCRAR
ncbi:hypothetical protein BDZ89DRAFT_1073060 [Hymenopellis radicata]|nr:hypothetical protein BDZ89DRAFT_1073060 [Hymenopellis radicata]